MKHIIILSLFVFGNTFLYGMEMDPADSLPNPYGFERRILLIDHLKEVYGLIRPNKTIEELTDEYKKILVGNHEVGPRGCDLEISRSYVLALQIEKRKEGTRNRDSTEKFTQGDAVRLQLEMEFGIILGPETDPNQAKILLTELLIKLKDKHATPDQKENRPPLPVVVASRKVSSAALGEGNNEMEDSPLGVKAPTVQVGDVDVVGKESKQGGKIITTTENIKIPTIHQLHFRDVWWRAYSADGKELALVRGGKIDGFLEAAGRIEIDQIVYEKKFEYIIRYSVIDNLTFEIETPCRILTVTRRINSKRKHWIVMKTTKGYIGDAHIQKFMIFGSENDR